jgi:tetratricopeptide (TPR) repeat protein
LRYPHAERTLALIEQALGLCETYTGSDGEDGSRRTSRLAVNIKGEAAVQLAILGRYEEASKLIGEAITLYRNEGWSLLLTRALEQSCR